MENNNDRDNQPNIKHFKNLINAMGQSAYGKSFF
jgi:hypothetical protein